MGQEEATWAASTQWLDESSEGDQQRAAGELGGKPGAGDTQQGSEEATPGKGGTAVDSKGKCLVEQGEEPHLGWPECGGGD